MILPMPVQALPLESNLGIFFDSPKSWSMLTLWPNSWAKLWGKWANLWISINQSWSILIFLGFELWRVSYFGLRLESGKLAEAFRVLEILQVLFLHSISYSLSSPVQPAKKLTSLAKFWSQLVPRIRYWAYLWQALLQARAIEPGQVSVLSLTKTHWTTKSPHLISSKANLRYFGLDFILSLTGFYLGRVGLKENLIAEYCEDIGKARPRLKAQKMWTRFSRSKLYLELISRLCAQTKMSPTAFNS